MSRLNVKDRDSGQLECLITKTVSLSAVGPAQNSMNVTEIVKPTCLGEDLLVSHQKLFYDQIKKVKKVAWRTMRF